MGLAGVVQSRLGKPISRNGLRKELLVGGREGLVQDW
jgi:hypothetical protein